MLNEEDLRFEIEGSIAKNAKEVQIGKGGKSEEGISA